MIALEHIAPEDWAAVERVRQALQSLVVDTGGQSIGVRFGAASVTWPGGSPFSTAKTVTHGLGRTPVTVLTTPNNSPSTCYVDTVGATTFNITLHTDDGSSPAAATTRTVYWLVIG